MAAGLRRTCYTLILMGAVVVAVLAFVWGGASKADGQARPTTLPPSVAVVDALGNLVTDDGDVPVMVPREELGVRPPSAPGSNAGEHGQDVQMSEVEAAIAKTYRNEIVEHYYDDVEGETVVITPLPAGVSRGEALRELDIVHVVVCSADLDLTVVGQCVEPPKK